MGKKYVNIGNYQELGLTSNCGSIQNYLQNSTSYNKDHLLQYLQTKGKRCASCAKRGVDCVTGHVLSDFLSFFTDGEFIWNDLFPYHVRKYNVKVPDDLVKKAENLFQEGDADGK